MNIYITLDDSVTVGGGQAVYNEILKHSKDSEILLMCPAGELAQLCSTLCKVEIISVKGNLLTKPILNSRVIRSILLKYKSKDIDLLHVQGINLMPLIFLSTFGLKYTRVYTEHLLTKEYKLKSSLSNFIQKLAYFILIHTYNKVICVSEAVQKYLVENMRVAKSKTEVVYNSVPALREEPIKHKAKDDIVICSIGSLNWVKNMESLVRVVTKLPSNIKCKIIGEGQNRKSITALIQQYKLEERVKLLGNLPRTEVLNELETSDIFVSTSFSESFGIAIAEALAVGIPVVAYKVGGIPEIVKENESGILVEPYKEEALAEAIVELAKDYKKRNSFGKYGFNSLSKFERVELKS